MGTIKKILENLLVGGTSNTDIYPVTSTKAVYDEDNEALDGIIKRKGVINISTNYNKDHTAEVLTLEQAIAKIPSKDRVLGFQGKYLATDGWHTIIYTGDNITSWSDTTKWIDLPDKILRSISKNATFGGIAIPNTNPSTSDGPVFYIATEAGTYSNFSGISVAEGEVVILQWNNGTWTKKTTGLATEQEIIYDVSARNSGVVFESLSALLSSSNLSTLIPTSVRHGGMSIRFIQSSVPNSDNKYVQYRLMAQSFTIDVTQWQGVDDEPTVGSDNLVKSGGTASRISDLEEKTSEISKETIGTKKDCISIEDNNGNEVFCLDENGLDAKNVKSNGKYVLTEHQDISGLATKKELESKQDLIQQISQSAAKSSESEQVFVSDDYDEDTGTGEEFASIGSYGIKAKQYLRIDGTPMADIVIDTTMPDVPSNTHAPSTKMIKNYVDSKGTSTIPPTLFAPNKLYCLNGTRLQVFVSGLMFIPNADNYVMNAYCHEGNGRGISIRDVYQYDVNVANEDFNVNFFMCDGVSNFRPINSTRIVHVNKGDSPSSMKNILIIGDSYTEQNVWCCELRRLITGELAVNTKIPGRKMYDDTDSAPTADTVQNINFVGSRTLQDGTPTLGTSGMHYMYYCSSESPLYNPTTEMVDFDYYVSSGLTGTHRNIVSGDKIDFCIILLGQNGKSTEPYMSQIWDALLAHNQNIRVIICGIPYTSIYSNNGCSRMTQWSVNIDKKKINAMYQERCESEKYKNNFLYVDITSRYDSLNAFGYKQVPVNRETRTLGKPLNFANAEDDIHPSYTGYFQIADAIRGAFHYWFLNSTN